MYLNTVNFNNTPEEDVKFLFKKDNKFILPDRLRKINYNRTIKDVKKIFLGFQYIHQQLKEHCLKKLQQELCLNFHIMFLITTKNNKYIYIIWKNYLTILKQYQV